MADNGRNIRVNGQGGGGGGGQFRIAAIIQGYEGETVSADPTRFINLPNSQTGAVDGIIAHRPVLAFKGADQPNFNDWRNFLASE
jgi:hypothetical protein